MKINFKQIIGVILFCLMIISFLGILVSIIHSTWFMFTNIHMTKMEILFAPENHSILKILNVGVGYGLFKTLEKDYWWN